MTFTAQNPGPWKHTVTGRKWMTHCTSRYFSGGFDFDTFRQAVAYARQIREVAKKDDARGLSDFHAYIVGPGGKISLSEFADLL